MYLGQLFEGTQAVQCFQKGIELMLKEKEEKEALEVTFRMVFVVVVFLGGGVACCLFSRGGISWFAY